MHSENDEHPPTAEMILKHLNAIEKYARSVGTWEEAQLGANFLRALERAGQLDNYLAESPQEYGPALTPIQREILKAVGDNEKILEKDSSKLSTVKEIAKPTRRQAIGRLLRIPASMLTLTAIDNIMDAGALERRREGLREQAQNERKEAEQPGVAPKEREEKMAQAQETDNSADEAADNRNLNAASAIGFYIYSNVVGSISNNMEYGDLEAGVKKLTEFSRDLDEMYQNLRSAHHALG